jgi:hypothetical protein
MGVAIANFAACPRHQQERRGSGAAWQFAGDVSDGKLPPGGAWKCFRLAKVRNARSRAGPWHEGQSHKSE